MAVNDVTVFNEAKAYMIDGGWEPADSIWCAILDNTLAPTAADLTPALADYTQVGTAGSYVTGGLVLDTLGTMVTQSGVVMTFDTDTDPSWAQNGSNDADASWGLIYNDTDAGKLAIAFVELGTVDMSAGSLTITWNAAGIFTIT
jgi:hypothetical protein